MITTAYYEKGSDEPITITVTGAPDLSLYEGYGVKFYVKSTLAEVEKYSKNAVTGWNNDDLDTTNEATGVMVVNFQRATGETLKGGVEIWGQLVAQLVDANYVSSDFREIGAPFYIMTVRAESLTVTEDMNP